MKKKTRLSTIALLAAALTTAPAWALSLNLGGDGPLVDLSNGNNADATVSVDTGNLLGSGDSGGSTGATGDIDVNLGSISGSDDGVITSGSGGVVNLGGDGGLINLGTTDDNSDGDLLDIEIGGTGGNGGLLDLGTDGTLIDLGGDGALLDIGGDDGLVDLASVGGTGRLLDLGTDGDLLDLGEGPLLDLSGNDDVDATVEIDLGATGGIGGVGQTGDLLDLGGTGDLIDLNGTGNLLDLGGEDELVALDLLGTKVDASVNLNGGDQPVVDVNIGTGQGGVAGTGVLPETSGSATVGGDNLATVSVTGPSGGNTGGGDDGDGGGGGNNGGDNNGGGGSGNGAGGPVLGGNGGGAGGSGTAGSLLAGAGAALADGRCLQLTEAQLDELTRRHTYNRSTFNGWASARSLKIVEVELCDRDVAEVEAAVGGNANVARLQAFLANQAKVRAGLESKGHSTGDVIAADHSGEVLIVYVI